MRKFTLLLFALLLGSWAVASPVNLNEAKQVADKYFSHYSGISNPVLLNSSMAEKNGIVTFYAFNYTGGGFVLVSADDAIIPVLAQSNEGYFDINLSNPEVKYWINEYNDQIVHIVSDGYDNSATLPMWNQIRNNEFDNSTLDVTPLLTTNWDQDTWYNYYCPAASTGPGGHVYAGCVATTMGQIMKFFNFPTTGCLSHSYTHPTYGTQTANFGATTYNWAGMGTSATSASYQPIAKLLYHAGVSVNMNYGADGSGAFSEDVPWAMVTYFNYHPAGIGIKYKADYTNTTWGNLLISELTAGRPLYYSGDDGTSGHAWVCDGYRSSDNKFHMNWGWSGFYNGYFAIGSLNAGGYTPNQSNAVVAGIRPGNANLIARFTDLQPNQIVPYGGVASINCSVLTGTPLAVNVYVNNAIAYSTTQTNFVFPWNTASYGLGTFTLKLEAVNATDTSYHEVTVGLSEWVPQASGFTTASRGINYMHAVDSLLVWAIAYDGSGGGATINEFTKTVDGGQTWTKGQVKGGTTYGLGNICGLSANVAYVALYNGVGNQDNTCGVYKTSNGGATWTQLPGALQGSASFANNVWFWNENEGMCHGDVKDNYFEIYTTSNGGTTWTRVPKANIGGGANPASGEGGWTSVIQAVGDSTIIFGSNKAKLYISYDRGHNWVIKPTGITPNSAGSGGINTIAFKDKMNGLVRQTVAPITLRETHDGGSTWTTITPTGNYFTNDMCFVPGTESTYITTGAATGATGASYSLDFGHSWAVFQGTDVDQFLALGFVNPHCGWAGGFNESATSRGMFKFVGNLNPGTFLFPITNLIGSAIENNVHLSWVAPAGSTGITGYNIYRDNVLINTVAAPQIMFDEVLSANGAYNYCVSVLYGSDESEKVCTTVYITVGTPAATIDLVKIYPNPATEVININSPVTFDQVRILNAFGQQVYNNTNPRTNLQILTQGFNPGMYVIQVKSGSKVVSYKISIR